MICLSAASLDVYSLCPRKFFYTYLAPDKLAVPLANYSKLGNQFHRLVEILTPLPPSKRQPWLDRVDRQVGIWWQNFCRSGLDQVEGRVYSEYPVRWQYRGWELQARYDRLVITATGYAIWDWKTGKEKVSWQQSLYPLLWHWYTNTPPETISLNFWYAPESRIVSFAYNKQQQEEDQAKLDRVLDQLEENQFPPTQDTSHCVDCFFRYHCWGRGEIA
ncbi:MAG: PD-(D/E)XK nuclease family protein [Pseudanabaenaceae cyanobacterium]